MNKLRAFVLYTEGDKKVIPMSLQLRKQAPQIKGVIPVEVNSSLCCDGEIPEVLSSEKLKAFMLYGKTGAIMGPIIRRNRPKGKGWKQIKYNLCCDSFVGVPEITTQPEDQIESAGDTATFSVVATGNAPLTYQWYLNGVEISGATSADYTTPTLTLGMNEDEYYVVVTNDLGEVQSSTATLFVTPATTTTTTSTSTTTTTSSTTSTTTTVP